MSTKTTFKRIALVAVAALGFGMLSVVPSQAADGEIEVTVGTVPTTKEAKSDVFAVADAGATEVNTPKPKAATVTSATRLKVVFVDICFLSISRSREFPSFGFELIS